MKLLYGSLLLFTACGRCDKYIPVVNTVVVTNNALSNNITCNVYDLNGLNFTMLPDYNTLNSLGSVALPSLNYPSTSPSVVFPPFVNTNLASLLTNFGMNCTSTFIASIAGNYEFFLDSDDGSSLYIDGAHVVNNDTLHSMSRAGGFINLTQGNHSLRVPYFQGPGYKGLILTVIPPGGVETVIDVTMLSK
jgi:hypothetical protein